MLDAKDLRAIAELIDARAEETEKRLSDHLEKLIDTRAEETEKRLSESTERLVDSKMDEMRALLDSRTDEMKALLDTRTKQMEDLIDTRISQSEVFLIDEMERYDRKYEKEFGEVKQRLGALEGVYRMTKNETETINLSLKLIENLDKRVTKLEARAAV
jgi:exonuclease VII large subunit